MKTIQEAGPSEVSAIKRRTIRTLAMGKITDEQSAFINKHLDAISGILETINKTIEEE